MRSTRFCPHRGRVASWRSQLLLALFLTLLLLAAAPARVHAQDNWWDEAAQQTSDEIDAVESTVDQTLSQLDTARTRLDEFEEFIEAGVTDPRERQRIQAGIAEAREALGTYSQPLETFNGHLGKVTNAMDKVTEIRAMADRIGQTRGGNAGRALRVIAIAMENYGQDVPIIGEVITAYGEATNAILDATNRIAETIDTNRNQGMFGSGTYGGVDNPYYQAMSEQFGEDFAAGYTFAPSNTPYVYEPIDPPGAFSMIWDPDAQSWVKADRPPAAIDRLYHSYLLAHGRPSPANLAALATVGYEPAANRLDAGEALAELWDDWLTASGSFYQVDQRNDYALSGFLEDPAVFAARFAHDADFNRQVREWLNQLYSEANQEYGALGRDEATLEALRAWADEYGIALDTGEEAKEEADEEDSAAEPDTEEPDEETDTSAPGTSTPGSGAAPDSSTGSGTRSSADSVVLLFDASGSMADDGKMDAAKSAARNVLAQVQAPTEVALIVFYGCGDIQVEHPFTTDYAAIQETIHGIQSANDTPLAAAITFGKQYIADNAHGSNARLVILSDGEETCGGDPVTAAAN